MNEIPVHHHSFTLNISGIKSVIEEKGTYHKDKMTTIYSYFQDNVEITKECYLKLEAEFKRVK